MKPKIDLFNTLVILALGACVIWVAIVLGGSSAGWVWPSP